MIGWREGWLEGRGTGGRLGGWKVVKTGTSSIGRVPDLDSGGSRFESSVPDQTPEEGEKMKRPVIGLDMFSSCWQEEMEFEEYLAGAVGRGWFPLLNRLYDDLVALGWDRTVLQVKEKFGGLRFYLGAASDEIYDRVERAMDESFETCEECGAKAELKNLSGWSKMQCGECERKEKEGREEMERRRAGVAQR